MVHAAMPFCAKLHNRYRDKVPCSEVLIPLLCIAKRAPPCCQHVSAESKGRRLRHHSCYMPRMVQAYQQQLQTATLRASKIIMKVWSPSI